MKIPREKNWLCYEYCVPDSKDGQERLKTLAWRGHLTLFDATE